MKGPGSAVDWGEPVASAVAAYSTDRERIEKDMEGSRRTENRSDL